MKFFIKFSSYVLASGMLGTSILQIANLKRSCFAKRWDYSWDESDHNYPNVSGIRNILLIRHGQYNTSGKTDEDKSLTSLGQLQAQSLGKYIVQISADLNIPITKVVCSNMKRARQTCELARKVFPEGTPNPTFTYYITEGPPHVFSPPQASYKPKLKTIEEHQERLDLAFKDHFHRPRKPGKTLEVYFCHANVIRYFFCKALQLPLNAWIRFSLRHCSVTHLVFYGDGKVACRVYGDTGFMNPELRSTS